MKLTLEFTKPFKDAVGEGEITFEFPDTTVRELLASLVERFPGLESMFYSDHGNITEYMIVFVNSRPISALDGMGTPLNDGDSVYILFPVSGE